MTATAAAVAPVPWFEGPMLALDCETDSPLPERARIVTAAVVLVHGRAKPVSRTWLVDPGDVDIPAEATAVHGITSEYAREHGRPAAEVIAELLAVLTERDPAAPLVVQNARFDLTVLHREARRHGIGLPPGFPWHVIDPFVIDRCFLDRFRRSYPRGMTPEQAAERGIPSSRTLAGMCQHYGARLDDAHAADADAIAAARLAWCIGARGEVVRRVRGREDAIEKARLVKEWEACRFDLARLHVAQQRWALAERVRFAEYKRSIGEHDEAARIDAERGWPVLEVMAHEEAA